MDGFYNLIFAAQKKEDSMNTIEKLREMKACSDAIKWFGNKTPEEGWKECERGDWAIWIAIKMADYPGWSSRQDVIDTLNAFINSQDIPYERKKEALGLSWIATKWNKRADMWSKRLFDGFTNYCSGFHNYNRLLLTEGNYTKILHFTDSICPLIDCDILCNWWYMNIYAHLNEFSSAEKYFKKLENARGEPTYSPIIGYVYYKLGRIKEAEEVFQACLKKYNENQYAGYRDVAWINYLRAEIYAFQNRKREALESIEAIDKIGFNFDLFDWMNYDPMFENLP